LIKGLLQPDPKQRWTVSQACDHAWFLIEDGDTHVHPLQDPAVLSTTSTRRKLFASQDTKNNHMDPPKNREVEKKSMDVGNEKPLTRSGSLFANAVGGSNIGNDSASSMSIVDEKTDQGTILKDEQKEEIGSETTNTSSKEESENIALVGDPVQATVSASADEDHVNSPVEDQPRRKDASVTPGSPEAQGQQEAPRSPLSPRSLNKDAPPSPQQRRKQVVIDPKLDDGKERQDTESPSDQPIKKRVAVTPSSNVRGAKISKVHQTSEPLELPEDEICSQFSQEDEIESFADDGSASGASTKTSGTGHDDGNSAANKRPRDDTGAATVKAESSKSKPFESNKKQKQMTLSDFFLKKSKN
jgi:hypothetical protein